MLLVYSCHTHALYSPSAPPSIEPDVLDSASATASISSSVDLAEEEGDCPVFIDRNGEIVKVCVGMEWDAIGLVGW